MLRYVTTRASVQRCYNAILHTSTSCNSSNSCYNAINPTHKESTVNSAKTTRLFSTSGLRFMSEAMLSLTQIRTFDAIHFDCQCRPSVLRNSCNSAPKVQSRPLQLPIRSLAPTLPRFDQNYAQNPRQAAFTSENKEATSTPSYTNTSNIQLVQKKVSPKGKIFTNENSLSIQANLNMKEVLVNHYRTLGKLVTKCKINNFW